MKGQDREVASKKFADINHGVGLVLVQLVAHNLLPLHFDCMPCSG